ncbi:acyltransferase [Legionella hackeliae]|uniref:1-acylglycerol-3-phosphate O-acyltransferase n=1 Tax=Legionella hackeliae TaxID=449 RepID=A0A0A8UQT7_LEGHA|nr:acyltransferase [Legionella hackeliae]KTD09594.1 acyltransferase [Legionella hackeliae]CEK11088.1 1-acylglycerol-3-phosphate O-acyltransferase [Legionella hackeliae]STX47838.1 putative acyltransferase [Legionella hackeliae]
MKNTKNSGGQIYGIAAILLLVLTTLLGFIPILLIGILKLFPNRRWKLFCTRWVDAIATLWSGVNNTYISRTQKITWEVEGLENLHRKNSYLIIANHQSWLDIVVLQRLFNRKIPVLKFFIKDQLKWVPLLGFAWWAMGCPFMKRYSKEYLEKKPHKKGKDLQATRKAIELFKHTPATVMSFVEGTRFSSQKSKQQKSPYQFLLKPKAGGIGFVISAMGQQFTSLLDVTIIYSNNKHSLWDFLCRRINAIKVHIRQLPIPQQFINSTLLENNQIQEEFRTWLNNSWHEKDNLIAHLKAK